MRAHRLLTVVQPVLATIVDLGYARYESKPVAQGYLEHFPAIRYAAKPERWGLPTDPIPDTSTTPVPMNITMPSCHTVDRKALSFQVQTSFPTSHASEDCLFLNLYKPLGNLSDLPVVVQIHGGGFQNGDAIGFPKLASLAHINKKPVIYVSINYRLGVFGFLAGLDVHNDGILNVGLHDQRFALKWVQKHIAKFGGDPRKVTIVGESAGAGSVLLHILANEPENSKLFRYGIMTSPYVTLMRPYDSDDNVKLYNTLLTKVGCSGGQLNGTSNSDVEHTKPPSGRRLQTSIKTSNSSQPLQCLRQVSDSLLHHANWDINMEVTRGALGFRPVIDTSYINKHVVELASSGKVNAQATLAGSNWHEGSGFVERNFSSKAEAEQYLADRLQVSLKDNAQFFAELDSIYDRAESVRDKVEAAFGDRALTCPATLITEAAASTGAAYRYFYNGYGHMLDVPHWLLSDETVLPEDVPPFDKAFINMMLSFVYDGKPLLDESGGADGVPGLPIEWPAYQNKSSVKAVLTPPERVNDTMGIRTAPASFTLGGRDVCDFWKKHYVLAQY